MSYSRKNIIKEVKFVLLNVGGLAPILLKTCCRITIIGNGKMASTRRKSFIACECVSSHPANPSWHTSQATRKETTWSRSEPQSRWFVCQSEGVWIQKTNFDAENDNATQSKSPEIQVQSDLSTEETWNTPRTAGDWSREIVCQTYELCDVTDTCPYIEPDVETNSEQPNNNTTNPRSSKYILRHNPNLIAMTFTGINSCAALVCCTERVT